MKSPHEHQHFSVYIFEHLFGAFFVFTIALLLGYVASAQTAPNTGTTTTTGIISDTMPPTPPALHLGEVSSLAINLYWDGATDNVGVYGYEFFKNGTPIARLTSSTYKDSSNLVPGSVNAYYVVAIDAAGNRSQQSNTSTVMVPQSTPGTTATASTTPPPPSTTLDTTPPTPPTLTYNGDAGAQLNFTFSGATDNTGVAGYQLFKNDTFVYTFTPTQTSYSDSSIIRGATYHFYAKAFDGASPPNVSAPGNVVYVTIPQTTATTTSPPTTITVGSIVSFTVTIAPITDCSSGKPMTEVFFAMSDLLGGKFQVSPDGGLTNTIIDWGKHVLPNGTYQWKGIVNTGYVADGISSDTFVLNGQCLTAVTAGGSITQPSPSPTGMTTTSVQPATQGVNTGYVAPAPTAVPLSTVRPTLHMFVDDMPITKIAPVFNEEQIELRVMTPLAKKVNFYAMVPNSPTPLSLGIGVVDDLLSNQDNSAWAYIWDGATAKESSYKVFARILRLDGTQVETPPVLLSISHQAPSALVQESDSQSKGSVSDSQRTEILTRVTDPTQCTSALECKVYCESHTGERGRCLEFARVNQFTETQSTPSLTDNIPIERLSNMLNDQHKRSKDIPEIVQNAADLTAYCADPAHSVICTDALLHNDLATADSLAAKKTELENARNNEEKLLTERKGVRAFIDTDGDGISDYDEVNIYHTNPNDPDTDHDGVSDGKELEAHTNPNGSALHETSSVVGVNASSTIKVVDAQAGEDVKLENPLLTGVTKKEMLSVTGVTALPSDTKNESSGNVTKIKFSGKSLPNSYVTIFIFSDPIVVTIKTDASGAWTYTLDKNLPDGSHQVMTAITDGGGRILAKSEPLPFVKQAAAVSVGSDAFVPTQNVPGFFTGPSLYAFIAILIGLLGAAFSIIGFISYRHTKDEMPLT